MPCIYTARVHIATRRNEEKVKDKILHNYGDA
jgi:hypothetical protein